MSEYLHGTLEYYKMQFEKKEFSKHCVFVGCALGVIEDGNMEKLKNLKQAYEEFTGGKRA